MRKQVSYFLFPSFLGFSFTLNIRKSNDFFFLSSAHPSTRKQEKWHAIDFNLPILIPEKPYLYAQLKHTNLCRCIVRKWGLLCPDQNPIEYLSRSHNSNWEKEPFKSEKLGAVPNKKSPKVQSRGLWNSMLIFKGTNWSHLVLPEDDATKF